MNQKNKPTKPHFYTHLLKQYAIANKTTPPGISELSILDEWLLFKNYEISMELLEALEEITRLKRQLDK